MNHFTIELRDEHPVILLLGAHSDDIEIGCSGTIMRLAARYPAAEFVWVTFSSDEQREAETRAAAKFLLGRGPKVQVRIERFRGSYFPQFAGDLKDVFESLKEHRPSLVLTHCSNDRHQDHRVVNELTWNTFRDHTILEYEIPKFDGDLGTPNVYVPLSQEQVRRKCRLLMECFPSQHNRAWFTEDTFRAIARLRGIECNAPEGFAEAFHGRKIALTL